MNAAYAYFDHEADIGVEGRGDTPEAALVAAAEAMFAIMRGEGRTADTEEVEAEIDFAEDDPEYSLVTWLNALLAAARERGAVFTRFALDRDGGVWRGRAWGRPWRRGEDRGTEVKGATLTMLSVREEREGWVARCVVDV